jgi:hypothetical protein
VLPRNRSQWYGTRIEAPISVADEALELAVVGAAVDRQQRDVDRQRLERRPQAVGDDRVARVVDARAVELEHVADEARVVGIAVGDGHAMDGRDHGHSAGARQLEPVAAVHAGEGRVRCRLADLGLARRRRRDGQRAAASRHLAQRVRVQVVDVLVRDQQPVDLGPVLVDGQRRVEARLVLGEERVDEDPPVTHVEAERGLPEPGDDDAHAANITCRPCRP